MSSSFQYRIFDPYSRPTFAPQVTRVRPCGLGLLLHMERSIWDSDKRAFTSTDDTALAMTLRAERETLP